MSFAGMVLRCRPREKNATKANIIRGICHECTSPGRRISLWWFHSTEDAYSTCSAHHHLGLSILPSRLGRDSRIYWTEEVVRYERSPLHVIVSSFLSSVIQTCDMIEVGQ